MSAGGRFQIRIVASQFTVFVDARCVFGLDPEDIVSLILFFAHKFVGNLYGHPGCFSGVARIDDPEGFSLPAVSRNYGIGREKRKVPESRIAGVGFLDGHPAVGCKDKRNGMNIIKTLCRITHIPERFFKYIAKTGKPACPCACRFGGKGGPGFPVCQTDILSVAVLRPV